jgi:ElaB/YqjD/DUF883 family membrane-anchored ribosome-binding protein
MAAKKNDQGVDYSELIDFLSKKFNDSREEIKEIISVLRSEIKEALKTKADKSDIENVRRELKSDINAVLTRINQTGNHVDDHRAEQLETRRKVDTHDKWITKAAPKIGVKIEE